MKIYEFIYCSCIYESGFSTISMHRTKSGAYKAMRKFLIDEYMEWYNSRIIYGKYKKGWSKYGEHEHWGIRETELLD